MVALIPKFGKITTPKPCYSCHKITKHKREIDINYEYFYTCIKCGNTI